MLFVTLLFYSLLSGSVVNAIKWTKEYMLVARSYRDCLNTSYVNVTNSLFPNDTIVQLRQYAWMMNHLETAYRYTPFCRALLNVASTTYRDVKWAKTHTNLLKENTIDNTLSTTTKEDMDLEKERLADHIYLLLHSGELEKKCTDVGKLTIHEEREIKKCLREKRKLSITKGIRFPSYL